MTATADEPGRTAYEARFAGHTLGPRGAAEAWEDLLPVHQAIWARVEEAVRAKDATGLDEAVAMFQRTLPHWTAYSIQLHSRGRMTRFVVEISRLQQDRTETLYCESGPTAVEAMQNIIASVPDASRQPDAPPAEGRAD
ncbi:MAG: hypothetical protein Q7T73_19480 [Beijerinckiaceae bacterium]|nr:hypothetical protein [Beijerinckiaceae bacterium]